MGHPLTFLIDGLGRSTPGYLWVSNDGNLLREHLQGLALRVAKGGGPDDFAGRPLLEIKAERLLDTLVQHEDAAALLMAVVEELAQSGATFAIDHVEVLLDSSAGRGFLDGLLDAVRDGTLGCFLALTDGQGFARVEAEAFRLLGLCTVIQFDDEAPRAVEFRSLVIAATSDDPSDLGWMVAVRCHLAAPAPALAALTAGSDVVEAGGIGAFDDERVQNLILFDVPDAPARAILVSITPEAADADQIDLAGEIAVDAARTAIWRSLRDDEQLVAVRQIHYR